MYAASEPGLQISLLVNGQQLVEYDDEDTFPSQTSQSKYVEVTSGSCFVVRVSSPSSAPHARDRLCTSVWLDGKHITSKIYDRRPSCSKLNLTLEGSDRNTSRGTVLERFQFAHLETTDGPVGKAKTEDFKDLGQVTVKCSWVRAIGETYVAANDERRHEIAIGSSVPEKCLKGRAISNHATLGAPEVLHGAAVTCVNTDYPYGREPFATFNFKYRSRRDLQIEGIIPRSPSPVPLEDRDPDDLSPEEARELVRRLRQTQQQQIEIKKEGQKKKRARSVAFDGSSDAEGVVITGEGSSRKRGRPSTDSGVDLIDLTED